MQQRLYKKYICNFLIKSVNIEAMTLRQKFNHYSDVVKDLYAQKMHSVTIQWQEDSHGFFPDFSRGAHIELLPQGQLIKTF